MFQRILPGQGSFCLGQFDDSKKRVFGVEFFSFFRFMVSVSFFQGDAGSNLCFFGEVGLILWGGGGKGFIFEDHAFGLLTVSQTVLVFHLVARFFEQRIHVQDAWQKRASIDPS